MYIPVINFLQISLPSLTKILDLDSAVDLLNQQRLAILTPYHDGPQVVVSKDLPSDCTVDQVMLVRIEAYVPARTNPKFQLHRHGSRGPTGEESYVKKLVHTLDSATLPKYLPKNLQFLKEGYKYDLVPDDLTIIGHLGDF